MAEHLLTGAADEESLGGDHFVPCEDLECDWRVAFFIGELARKKLSLQCVTRLCDPAAERMCVNVECSGFQPLQNIIVEPSADAAAFDVRLQVIPLEAQFRRRFDEKRHEIVAGETKEVVDPSALRLVVVVLLKVFGER